MVSNSRSRSPGQAFLESEGGPPNGVIQYSVGFPRLSHLLQPPSRSRKIRIWVRPHLSLLPPPPYPPPPPRVWMPSHKNMGNHHDPGDATHPFINRKAQAIGLAVSMIGILTQDKNFDDIEMAKLESMKYLPSR